MYSGPRSLSEIRAAGEGLVSRSKDVRAKAHRPCLTSSSPSCATHPVLPSAVFPPVPTPPLFSLNGADTYSPRSRKRILSLYGALHAHGVLHRDVDRRNVLRHPETGKLSIIDFGMSRSRSRIDEGEVWEEMVAEEMREVNQVFG